MVEEKKEFKGFFTAAEAAHFLGVTTQRIYQLKMEGRLIPRYKKGMRSLYVREDLEKCGETRAEKIRVPMMNEKDVRKLFKALYTAAPIRWKVSLQNRACIFGEIRWECAFHNWKSVDSLMRQEFTDRSILFLIRDYGLILTAGKK